MLLVWLLMLLMLVLLLLLLMLLQVLLVKNMAHIRGHGGHGVGVRQQVLAHGKVLVALHPARVRFDAADVALDYRWFCLFIH